jgi:nucleotide-binding universal stress UspA family protein
VRPQRILLAWRPAVGHPVSGTAAVAAWLARSQPVLVRPVTVIPRLWPEDGGTGPAAGHDAGRRAFDDWAVRESAAARRSAVTALREAGVPDDMIDVPDSTDPVVSHSETTALTDAAQDFGADLILIGSREDAPAGRFRTGATADALLHCSPLPVLTAPNEPVLSRRGVTRVTCAYVDTEQSRQALRHAADRAARWEVPLRLVALTPAAATMYPATEPLPGTGTADAGDTSGATGTADAAGVRAASQAWLAEAAALLDRGVHRALERHPELTVTAETGTGTTWQDAVDALHWKKGDLLVVGSSVLGSFNRVFIGPSTNQILRTSPAPVLISAV